MPPIDPGKDSGKTCEGDLQSCVSHCDFKWVGQMEHNIQGILVEPGVSMWARENVSEYLLRETRDAVL